MDRPPPFACLRIRRPHDHIYLYGSRDDCARVLATLDPADVVEDDGAATLFDAYASSLVRAVSPGLVVGGYESVRVVSARDWLAPGHRAA